MSSRRPFFLTLVGSLAINPPLAHVVHDELGFGIVAKSRGALDERKSGLTAKKRG